MKTTKVKDIENRLGNLNRLELEYISKLINREIKIASSCSINEIINDNERDFIMKVLVDKTNID